MIYDEFAQAYYAVFERALYFAVKSRVEGLLSLEDEINHKKVDKRDIFEYGIRFVIDGTDVNFIDKILSNIITQEKDENTALLKTIQKEAVLSIALGDNPRILIALLNSYVDIPLDDPKFIKISEMAETLKQEIEQRIKNKNYSMSLETVVSDFKGSEFIAIGSRPGFGKTSLALTMAANMAFDKNKPVAFFSLEMSKDALLKRLSKISDYNSENIQDSLLYIIDNPGMNILELEQHIRDLFSEKKIEAVFIDYLWLVNNDNLREPRHKLYPKLILKLKTLAKELNIPVIAILPLLRREDNNPSPNGIQAVQSAIYSSEESFRCIDKIFHINKNGLTYFKNLHNDNEEFDELIQPQIIQWSIPQ
jgi:hypothetical protein